LKVFFQGKSKIDVFRTLIKSGVERNVAIEYEKGKIMVDRALYLCYTDPVRGKISKKPKIS